MQLVPPSSVLLVFLSFISCCSHADTGEPGDFCGSNDDCWNPNEVCSKDGICACKPGYRNQGRPIGCLREGTCKNDSHCNKSQVCGGDGVCVDSLSPEEVISIVVAGSLLATGLIALAIVLHVRRRRRREGQLNQEINDIILAARETTIRHGDDPPVYEKPPDYHSLSFDSTIAQNEDVKVIC